MVGGSLSLNRPRCLRCIHGEFVQISHTAWLLYLSYSLYVSVLPLKCFASSLHSGLKGNHSYKMRRCGLGLQRKLLSLSLVLLVVKARSIESGGSNIKQQQVRLTLLSLVHL